MADIEQLHRTEPTSDRRKRFAFALRAHAIEDNPLSPEQIEMFEQFDRDGLSDSERRAVLTQRAQKLAPG